MGCRRRNKRIKTVEIWFHLGRGTSWEEGGDEDDEDELTQSKLVWWSLYSVLLLFAAPGSFSCNLAIVVLT